MKILNPCYWILPLMAVILFIQNTCAQKINPDSYFHTQLKTADSLLAVNKSKPASKIYFDLFKKYNIWGTDVTIFLDASIATNDASAFREIATWFHQNSYDNLADDINSYVEYGMDKVSTNPELLDVFNEINNSPKNLNPSLNHKAILFIGNMMGGDEAFRTQLPDMPTKNMRKLILYSDPIRFNLFFDYVEKNGLPKWTELGIYAGSMQTFLHHNTFNGMGKNETVESAGFVKWLKLAALIQKRSNEGEFSWSFFHNTLLAEIKYILDKNKRSADFIYFENYLGTNP